METTNQIKDIADKLVTTLDTMMPSEQADAIVRDVIEELYNDILGIKGKIVVDTDSPVGILHGGFGKNGKRAAMTMAKYKFEVQA